MKVAPLVGAWIEMTSVVTVPSGNIVAPLVGAWIEMTNIKWIIYDEYMSLPLWERGLK